MPFRFRHTTRATGAPLLATMILFCGPAFAGDWKLTDSATVSASMVNRDQESGGDTDRLVLSATPGFQLSGQGGRISANLSYALTASHEADGGDDDSLSHSLNGSFNSRLYEDSVFLNGSAFAGLATTSNSSASADPNSPDSESIQTYSFGLSPQFRGRLGPYANLVSNNRFRVSGSDRGSSDDVTGRTLNIGVQNGREFGRLNWFGRYTNTYTDFTDRDETVDSVVVGGGYRINRQWKMNASTGYSESDAATRRSSNSAANWSLGIDWTPNPRTSGSFDYGRDYSGDVWSGRITHVTRRTTIAGYFSRSLTNTSALLASSQEVLILDASGAPILDAAGNPLVISIPILEPTSENFINSTVGASVTLNGLRTSVSGSANYSDREYDVTGNTQKSIAYRLSASRKIKPNVSMNISAGYSDFSSSSDPGNNTLDLSIGTGVKLGRRSNLSVSLSHRVYDAETGPDYDEQRLTLSFSTRFL